MSAPETSLIGIAGAGPIGAAVAQLCAQAGLPVLLAAPSEESLQWAEGAILRGLHRAEQPGAFGLVRKSTRFGDLEDCDLVLEAGDGPLSERGESCRSLDARLDPSRVLAVHTGLVPVGHLARGLENPERVLGMHFFPPFTSVGVAEVARPAGARMEFVAAADAFVRKLGKSPLPCLDRPGFIVERLWRPCYLAALRLLEQGRGTPAGIDAAMKEAGFRMGPFEHMDAVGLEESFSGTAALYELLERPERLRPSALQEKLLSRGCRGRRNARGFYVYGENSPGTVNPLLEELVGGLGQRPLGSAQAAQAVWEGVASEIEALLREGTASREAVEAAMPQAAGWPRGPYDRRTGVP